ncbi:MAG: VWA domain-containing protein [Desulfobacterales bacterium]|nr:VWA domain-containing protein [Desulfobacterales bacterium]
MVPDQDPLEYLASADPALADRLRAAIHDSPVPCSDREIRFLVDEILKGFVAELSFGQAYARGIETLIGLSGPGRLHRYCTLVDDAGQHGPALGKLYAGALVEVVAHDPDRFTDRFLQVTAIMLTKGAYTLKDPLHTLSGFLAAKDAVCANAYLELLSEVFGRPLTYNRCMRISKRLPRLVAALPRERRAARLAGLRKVMAANDILMEPFFDGLDKGVGLLDEKALAVFVQRGLEVFHRDRAHGIRFFELASLSGIDTCRALQVAMPLSAVRGRLDRYLQARVGKGLTVKAVTDMPAAYNRSGDNACVYFDGATLYFQDVINRFATQPANADLYMCLARLESGAAEFGTFDFDLQKMADRQGINLAGYTFSRDQADLDRFFMTFAIPDLAADLFTIVEHGRLRLRLAARYPGLDRAARVTTGREVGRLVEAGTRPALLYDLYARIALGLNGEKQPNNGGSPEVVERVVTTFNTLITDAATVETSAGMVREEFSRVVAALVESDPVLATRAGYPGLKVPFGRKVRPALHHLRFQQEQVLARRIRRRMNKAGFKAYRSDLVKLLREKRGRLSSDDLRAVVIAAARENGKQTAGSAGMPDPGGVSLVDLLPEPGTGDDDQADGCANVFRYPEWDSTQNEYLVDHARLTEKKLTGHANGFYQQTLQRHRGLVKRIKTAFELLKPEGIQILRQWIEGDDFDYRAMLDYALDKRAGIMPSDRLYIKRMKSARDVAVMLLVDLSKSTANTVRDSADTVLDVEKEAIVLFCEALEVVGDTYAVSGFSGTGRLGVDFFAIKRFKETMGLSVRKRINAMAPQRNTRMGAAIRHAAQHFRRLDSAVKLLIVLGDGYPNDAGYKKRYAIEDTRKAIFEARSRNIYTHGITVNIRLHNEMDDLFGSVHHTAISDVRELPDKLWRIYSSLTR